MLCKFIFSCIGMYIEGDDKWSNINIGISQSKFSVTIVKTFPTHNNGCGNINLHDKLIIIGLNSINNF